ncbi:MAG: nucleoside-diphosphate sugar epimerase/dehydratase, partial [Victivallales bacterium]|nr:nucleoside-diphosphate sugar epimerase/dehydratase [Victivallales bacterium]
MKRIVPILYQLSNGRTVRLVLFFRKPLVLLLNIATVLGSLMLAFAIRFEFAVPPEYVNRFVGVATVFLLVKMSVIFIFSLNQGLWRYFSLIDIARVLKANLFASSILLLIFYSWRDFICVNFPLSVLITDFLICFLTMSLIRGGIRIIREINDSAGDSPLIKTAVVGKLEDVDAFLHGMEGKKTGRKIVAVFTPEKNSESTIRGIKIKGTPQKIAFYAQKNNINEIVLIPPYSRKRFLNLLLKHLEKLDYECALKIVPGADHITKGEINLSAIRKVRIEDLLGRDPVKFDNAEVATLISGKNIMVTGGGGSIGNELCLQICRYFPGKLLIFEFSEYNLYETERILKEQFPYLQIEAVLGDIRFKDTLCKAMREHAVDVLYHAAAYKHVPMLEKNIAMAVHTNIIGTSNVADCAEACGVKRVVVISTDKAVRPTSVMGATKRIAERIILERENKGTEFVVVRFGNVLGSRGSVIPLFKQQIADGGPVTITSREMNRYFMSIPEAVDLMLQAGTIGNDRDIMILEMGKLVNIYEMAIRLIELSGFKPHRDIQIKEIGARPGEKEYEELLTKEELVDSTPFDRICVARKKTEAIPPVNLEAIAKW